jgi:ABC-type branched-subunit amino acid transport system ATPase component
MAAALEIRGITKRFGSLTAVKEVSFTVERGQIVGFIGPNGAGKTTTMRICATLEYPDQGDVLIDGHSVLGSPREVRAPWLHARRLRRLRQHHHLGVPRLLRARLRAVAATRAGVGWGR